VRIWRWVIIREERLRGLIRGTVGALEDFQCYIEDIPECRDEEELVHNLVGALYDALAALKR
jgi:hypothetical protein